MERDDLYIKLLTLAAAVIIGIFKIFPLVKGFMPNGGSGMWLMASVLCFVSYFLLYPFVKVILKIVLFFAGFFKKTSQ